MNAAEARQRTLFAKTRDTVGAELYKLVVARIIEAADKGHDNLMHPFDYGGRATPTPDEVAAVRKRLIADGYIVTDYADPDPGHPASRPFTSVSWGHGNGTA